MTEEENKNSICLVLNWQDKYFKKLFTENNFAFLSDLKEKLEFEKFCINISTTISICGAEQFLISKEKCELGKLLFINGQSFLENYFENNTNKIFYKIRGDLRKDITYSFVASGVKFNDFIIGNFVVGNMLGNKKVVTDIFFANLTDSMFSEKINVDKIHAFVNGMKELHKEDENNKLSKALLVSIFYSGLFLDAYKGKDIEKINEVCFEELNKLISYKSNNFIGSLLNP